MEQETIIFPSSLRVIEDGAFQGRKGLKSIVVPDTVEEIGNDAFEGTSLEEIVFPRELRKLGQMNGYYFFLRKLDFSKVRHLEEFPAYFLSPDTPELKELALPIGVKKVGESIGGSNLKKLFLPPTVEVVDDLCQTELDIFCFSPKIETLGMMVADLRYPDEYCRLYVLPEYLEAYKAQQEAEGVSNVHLIIEEMPEEYWHYYDE